MEQQQSFSYPGGVKPKGTPPCKVRRKRAPRRPATRQTYSGLTKTDAKASRILNPLESVEQTLFFRSVHGMAYLYPELIMAYHTPNENKSGIEAIGVENKKQGVRAGVPDNCLPLPRGGWAGWYGELKRNIGDGPSEQQWEYIIWLRAHGFWANWHRGNQALFDDLMAYYRLPFPKGARPPQPPLRVEELCTPPERLINPNVYGSRAR